jgi:uncharacterized protein
MLGTVVHIELPAGDAERATSFWSSLFGWQFVDSGMPGMAYLMAQAGPEQGVAIFPSDKPGTGPIDYFACDEIDATIARVRELGGEADEKAPVPGHGWFAACRDTEGNRFSLWQADASATMPA